MIVTLLVLAVLFAVWRWRKRRRTGILAGRDALRPTYTIEPPMRRQVRASKEVL